MGVGREDMEILKPRIDKREYRRIVIRNSLQCAASMNVSVGSFCDPDGLEGLAHFLDDIKQEAYSEVKLFHRGRTNAFTASEMTNYFFDVNTDCFEEALDRFAQFFIKPLMSANATMREIKAVDSENQKNLLSDAWRMNQLQKHLSLESHPYHKFSIGTKFFVVCEPGTQHMEALLKVVYELYTGYVLKNPFYEMEMPIRFELFDINLTQAVQKDRVALLGL
ncbi:hypothetical protein ES332_D10G101800v1 [Gossypium tomentosum]|uniref:Trafficking protein particle complex subunit n=1 Tax=Gossypium tomentosum TaxID=34277 RepID=A0A5D2J247_GOSTO|nr:hypothetical protein ES332_D10G101800v1 [Gossypium tomentosum]